ncbi:MAG: threonine/serine exporter family protein [Muribaculaceae bacterium]|nr:threonine/serine exporter family protein [Muribaculaceae bacterium]
MHIFQEIVQDAFFAAIAAIGFAAISNPPRATIKYSAIIAAVGHATRFCLMRFAALNIVVSSLAGAFFIGILAIIISPKAKCPPETFAFPALLPMIPGIYAYRTIQAFVMSMAASGEDDFNHYFYLCESNGITCAFVILAMVLGQMIPILMFKNRAFSSTRG